MITIFVGDVGEYLCIEAQRHTPTAQLITESSNKTLTPGTYYISLGDFTDVIQFSQFLAQADQLIYQPPVSNWSSPMQQITEFYLMYFADKAQVTNIEFKLPQAELSSMLALADIRKDTGPQLWVAGCSVSHGVGVDPHERFGEIVAEELKLPVSFLTCPASSIEWAADQLLRSDIKPGDTVVWGLTAFERFAYYRDQQVGQVTVHYYQRNPGFDHISLDELDSDNRIYQAVTRIYSVVNFCAKLKVKLVIAGLLPSQQYLPYLFTVPGYTHLKGTLPMVTTNKNGLDVGTDGRHPGPVTHRWYAEQILNKLNSDR